MVEDALVLPSRRFGGNLLHPSVIDAAGSPIADALNYNASMPIQTEFQDRSAVKDAVHLEGAWLYGGILYSHFGHFLFESISRLWPIDALRDQVSGIVFVGLRQIGGISEGLSKVLGHLDVRLPLHFVNDPTVVQRLYVPRQGSAMGPLASGTPTFRAFVREKLTRIEPRPNVGRIYLTREAYRLARGGIFAEDRLRSLLEAAGYSAYSPEAHSFEDQVATYRGATHIVGPDSSALHLVAYVARPETKVAIVLRRHDGARDLLPQLAGHLGVRPLVINAIDRMMMRDNHRNPTWSTFAELDFRRVYFALRQAGFLRGRNVWTNFPTSERDALLEAYEKSLNGKLNVIWSRESDTPADLHPAVD